MASLHHALRVRYSDCDPQGVVFNANYLTYFDIAITELWREALGPYEEVMAAHGIDIVVAETTLRFKAPISFDEEVELVLNVTHLGTTAMITSLAIHGDAGIAAEGEMRHVFVGRDTPGKTPIPDPVREALEPYLDQRDPP